MASGDQRESESETAAHRASLARLLAMLLVAGCGSGGDASPDAAPRCTPGMHDEDGDGVVDACDNCPATANPLQEDTTELAVHGFDDGVGDACDFRPGLSGDRLAAFYPWTDTAELGSWTASGATVAADELVLAGTARLDGERTVQGDGLIVAVQLTSVSWDDPPMGALVIAIDGDGITAGDVCTLRPAAGGGEELVAAELAGGVSAQKAVAGDASAGQQLVAWRRLTLGGNEIACRVRRGNTQTEVVVPLADDVTLGTYAIEARGASARSASVIVMSTPGPKTR